MACNRNCFPFCPNDNATGKEKEIVSIIFSLSIATYEVLTRTKNFNKPPFGTDIQTLMVQAFGEIIELSAETEREVIDYQATRAEAADTIAYLGAIIAECDRKIKGDN